jgi:glycosyltransferase involved in cell wall biosynthesis
MTIPSTGQPLVSIGIPVFNGENYVEQALGSVLAQTMGDFEIVVSDNASTDRTSMICQDLAATDRRIRYYRNERNLGAGANYNLAFAKSRADQARLSRRDGGDARPGPRCGAVQHGGRLHQRPGRAHRLQ